MDTVPPSHQAAGKFPPPKWQDTIPNIAIVKQCKITGIESILFPTQFRWCGHVTCMPDDRIHKRLLYGQLPNVKRHPSGQQKRYKDQLRVSLRACEIDHVKWEELRLEGLVLQCSKPV